MTQKPKRSAFTEAKPKALSMPEAIARAKEALALINSAPIDAVRSCTKSDDGTWSATFDVIESPARMGDNDLLSAYQLTLDETGDLMDFRRTERFYREDRVAG